MVHPAFEMSRAVPRTWYPRCRNSLATWEPMKPLTPVTRMVDPFGIANEVLRIGAILDEMGSYCTEIWQIDEWFEDFPAVNETLL